MKDYIKQILMQWCNRPILSVAVLALVGIITAMAFRREPAVSAETIQRSSAMHRYQTQKMQGETEDNLTEDNEESIFENMQTEYINNEEIPPETELTIDRLYLAYLSEQQGEENATGSYAEAAINYLQEKDSQWFKNIYRSIDKDPLQMSKTLGRGQAAVLGRYNPNDSSHDPNNPQTWVIHDWSNVKARFVNGAGKSTDSSNIKAILAMASVYFYHHPPESEAVVIQYVENIWKRTHNHSTSMGSVYYCSGCMDHNWKKPELPAPTEAPEVSALIPENWDSLSAEERAALEEQIGAMRASLSQAQAVENPWNYNCPGHLDLTVTIRVHGIDEKKGLFSKDNIGGKKDSYTEQWGGWTEENRQHVKALCGQDWQSEYGIYVSPIVMLGKPLTEAEIQEYLNLLPADLSNERQAFIRYGLEAVGKIPYYWGGKPSAEGYEGNRFGTVITADYKGRFLKGLDCSGLVNWIYWSVFHQVYPYDGTEGFVASSTPISKDQLQPGDIGVIPGENSHAVIFLAWENPERTKMYAVHSTGKPLNTIVVNVVSGDWPYYRRIIE